MRLKIIGKPLDGSDIVGCMGIKIVNADTNEVLDNVRKVSWECGVGELAIAKIELIGAECEIDGILTKDEFCTCEDFEEYNTHERTCPKHKDQIKIVETTALGDEYKNYRFTPGKQKEMYVCGCLSVEEHNTNCLNKISICPDCHNTGKIQGFLQEYNCEKCKGAK